MNDPRYLHTEEKQEGETFFDVMNRLIARSKAFRRYGVRRWLMLGLPYWIICLTGRFSMLREGFAI